MRKWRHLAVRMCGILAVSFPSAGGLLTEKHTEVLNK